MPCRSISYEVGLIRKYFFGQVVAENYRISVFVPTTLPVIKNVILVLKGPVATSRALERPQSWF